MTSKTKTKTKTRTRPAPPPRATSTALARRRRQATAAQRRPDATRLTQAAPLGSVESLFSRAQEDIILAPARDNELDVLPSNGAIYMPHVHCRRRLTQAFRLAWRLEPKGAPIKVSQGRKASNLCQEWALYVGDYFLAQAMGFASYYENNPSMDWGDAMEAAKSNALSRCCKSINVGDLLVFDKLQAKQWRDAHCVAVRALHARTGKIVIQWRRKDADPLPGERGVATLAERTQVTGDPSDEQEGYIPATVVERTSADAKPIDATVTPAPAKGAAPLGKSALVPPPEDQNTHQVLVGVELKQKYPSGQMMVLHAVHGRGVSEYLAFDPPIEVKRVRSLIERQAQVILDYEPSTKRPGSFKVTAIVPL